MAKVKFACGCVREVNVWGTKKQVQARVEELGKQICWHCQQQQETPRLAVESVSGDGHWRLACYRSYKVKDQLKARGWRFVGQSINRPAHWEYEANGLEDMLQEAKAVLNLCPMEFEKMLTVIDLEKALQNDEMELAKARQAEEEARRLAQAKSDPVARMYISTAGLISRHELCVENCSEELQDLLKSRGYRKFYVKKYPFTVFCKGFESEAALLEEVRYLLTMGVRPYGERLEKLLS